jgi:F-box protein 9
MDDNTELNAFRRQWQEEVTRRIKPVPTPPSQPPSQSTVPSTSHRDRLPPTRHEAAYHKDDDGEEDLGRHKYGEFVQQVEQLSLQTADEDSFQRGPQKEPRSALEHFETAVEKEAEGNLGDSLSHYRKAYRVSTFCLGWQSTMLMAVAAGCRCRPGVPQKTLRIESDAAEGRQYPCYHFERRT